MKRLTITNVMLLIGLGITGCAPPIPPTDPETTPAIDSAIVGDWRMQTLNGRSVLIPRVVTFRPDGTTLTRYPNGPMPVERGRFVVEPSASPPEIDFEYPDGGTVKGIYRVEGDTLIICHAQVAAGERPREFTGVDDETALCVYTRARPNVEAGSRLNS